MRCTVFILLLLASSASAQEVTSVDDVVVTASRTEQKLADSPVATELISREDLAQSGAGDVAEYLQKHPGIHIVPSTFGTRIQMQGLDSKYIIVLVDGEKVIGRKYGILDLSRFTTENVERIEIVKGNMSALYGSEAIGGVINIITRKISDGTQTTIHGRGGQGGQFDGSAAFSQAIDNVEGRISADWRTADSFDLDDTDEWTTGNSREQFSIAGKLGYEHTENLTITARGDFTHQRTEGVDVSGAAILDRHNTTEVYTSGVVAQLRGANSTNTTARMSYTDYEDIFVYDQRRSDAMDELQVTTQRLGLVGLQHDRYMLNDHYVSVGLESSYESMVSARLEGNKGERNRSSIYVQDEWELDTKNLLVLLPGIRMDHDSQFGTYFSPKLSVRYDPSSKIVCRASYGLGFRAPDFKEMYLLFEHPGVGYRIVGNPDLRPETSLSGSASIEYSATEDLWFSLSGFRHDVDDLIQAELEPITDDPLFHWLGVYRNVSQALLQGADVAAQWTPMQSLSFDAGYSFLDTEDKDTAEPLEGRAKHSFNGSITFYSKLWNLNVRGTWVGERPFSTEGSGYGTEMADPYLLADTRLSWQIKSQTLFCGITNLLDEGNNDYLPVRPRAAFAGMDLTF